MSHFSEKKSSKWLERFCLQVYIRRDTFFDQQIINRSSFQVLGIGRGMSKFSVQMLSPLTHVARCTSVVESNTLYHLTENLDSAKKIYSQLNGGKLEKALYLGKTKDECYKRAPFWGPSREVFLKMKLNNMKYEDLKTMNIFGGKAVLNAADVAIDSIEMRKLTPEELHSYNKVLHEYVYRD